MNKNNQKKSKSAKLLPRRIYVIQVKMTKASNKDFKEFIGEKIK